MGGVHQADDTEAERAGQGDDDIARAGSTCIWGRLPYPLTSSGYPRAWKPNQRGAVLGTNNSAQPVSSVRFGEREQTLP